MNPETTSANSSRINFTPADFFSMLPPTLQAEGWVVIPRTFLLEQQHLLTDREFLVFIAVAGRATKDAPTWKPEPQVLGVDLGLRPATVSSAISKIVALDIGFVRNEDRTIDSTAFWAKHEGDQFARIPWVWLQLHAALEIRNHRHARILLLLAALWNPRQDNEPFLSQRYLAKVLRMDRSNARRSLLGLPTGCRRSSGPGRGATAFRG